MKIFTVGQVANICKVSAHAVKRWFDYGGLEGYRIPGTHDRRITREGLIKFMKKRGMPLGDLEDDVTAKVLIVSQDLVLIENLKREMPMEKSFRVEEASNTFLAGVKVGNFQPDCIIIDHAMGNNDALQICQNVHNSPDLAETTLVSLVPDDGSPIRNEICSVTTEAYKKPFDAALVSNRIRAIVGTKKDLA